MGWEEDGSVEYLKKCLGAQCTREMEMEDGVFGKSLAMKVKP